MALPLRIVNGTFSSFLERFDRPVDVRMECRFRGVLKACGTSSYTATASSERPNPPSLTLWLISALATHSRSSGCEACPKRATSSPYPAIASSDRPTAPV
jgi:hypothetical protein